MPGNQGELSQVLHIVEEDRDIYQKEKKVSKGPRGEVIIWSDVYTKIATWMKKFIEVGDTAVQYDPGHAALPWAAVRFILQSSINHDDRHSNVVEGVVETSRLLVWSKVLEKTCLMITHQDVPQLMIEITSLYVAMLRFLSKAHQFYSKTVVGMTQSSYDLTDWSRIVLT